MPRTYVRKTYRSSYPKEKLLEAVRAVKSGALSGYEASKYYGIPRATIINRVYERKGMKSNTLGRATVLSRDVEENLVKNLHAMEKYGFGLTRKELMETVGLYVTVKGVDNPFKNGIPGEDWFLSFKKRHNISVKKPQPVEYARKAACRPNVIYPYFDLLEETVNQLDLRDKPSHIWNVDETSFSKDPSKAKVVGLKGFTSTRTISSPGKDNTTVLLGCNAFGEKAPPLIIYKGKNVWDEWTSQEGYPGTAYAATANGWMESAVFEAWFEKVFLPTVGQKRPILLVYDGHSTHVGINIIEKARAAQITILKIPPHTSDVLQPLDLAVNKAFKDRWDAALVKWQRLNIGKTLPKKEFAKILGQIWTAIDPNVCAAGFKKAGIYPLNKDIVPESKFNQLLLREWKQTTMSLINHIGDDKTKSADIRPLTQDQQNSQPIRRFNPDLLLNITLAKINCIYQAQSPPQQRHQNLNDLAGCSKQLPETENPKPKEHIPPQQRDQNWNDLAGCSKQLPLTENPKPNIHVLENRVITFEDLLLMNIKVGTSNKIKRKRIAPGAEVITNDDVYQRCKQMEVEKTEKLKQKQEKKSKANVKQEIKQKSKSLLKTTCPKKESNKNLSKKKKTRVRAESSSESEIEMDIRDESEDDSDYEQYCKDIYMQYDDKEGEEEEIDEINRQTDEKKTNKKTRTRDMEMEDERREDKENTQKDSNLNVVRNDWLLVEFCSKRSVKHYVGVVLRITDDGVPVVQYVRKTLTKVEDQTMFTYPALEDISEVKHQEDIVTKLPKPAIGRRGQIIFKMSFKTFNVQ